MSLSKVPNFSSLSDGQFIRITGPDGITISYHYDEQSRSLFSKESQVSFPSFHGVTHVSDDLIPSATCDTPGLLSADDKCKLDELFQTRIGVLGYTGAGHCVTPDCRVLMDDGSHKPIKDIVIGDMVIGHSGQPRMVTNVYSRNECGDIYDINVRGHKNGGLKVTGDHKILAVKRVDLECVRPDCAKRSSLPCRHNTRNCPGCEFENIARTTPKWIKAKDIEKGDFIVARHSSRVVDNATNYIEPAKFIDCAVSDGRVYTIGKQVKVWGNKQPAGSTKIVKSCKTSLPEKLPLTPDFMKLLGYYVAEGYSQSKRLSFAIHKEEFIDGDIGGEIVRIMKSLFGVDYKIVEKGDDNNGMELVYHHATLARLLSKMFGRGAHNKRIPRWITELPEHLQKPFLTGIMQGDEHAKDTYSTKNVQLKLCNQELVEQVACMLERCGALPSLYPKKTHRCAWAAKEGRTVYRDSYGTSVQADTASWLWESLNKEPNVKQRNFILHSRQGDHLLREVTSVNTIDYNGDVHDLSVDVDNSYIVNGLVIHNSDDGGYMQGDVILAAGSEFISLERIGNVIRFTVDSPIPLNCGIEACAQIFWVQDESDTAAIRPPSCGGRMPGINGYGELKIYAFPESTIVDPNNTNKTLKNKGNYPSLIFKRYDDSITPNQAEFDMVLRRDPNNESSTLVGWAMTPGPLSVPECVWYMGDDSDGNRIRFELSPQSNPNLLGNILCKGHLLTKQMAVITAYTPQTTTNNQYKVRFWDPVNTNAIGDDITATNMWGYNNPTLSSKSIRLDRSLGLLEIGDIVDLWFFKIGETSNSPINTYFFVKEPNLKAKTLWEENASIEFGNLLTARSELTPSLVGDTDVSSSVEVSALRTFERTLWGLTGFDNPLILFDSAETGGPSSVLEINKQHRAVIDTSLPGMKVDLATAGNPFSERPVYLWSRKSSDNFFISMDVGSPTGTNFPPYDILLTAPIDSYENVYARCIGEGPYTTGGGYWALFKGAHFRDLPEEGTLRIITGANENLIWNYTDKMVYPSLDDDAIALGSDVEFPGGIGDVVELLHREYNAPCVRIEFTLDESQWQTQFKVGILDMSVPYETDLTSDDVDDYVRGLADGYAVSSVYTQDGGFPGSGTAPNVNYDGWTLYDGGYDGPNEYWNRLDIMYKDGQMWIWWNELLIPPDPVLSSQLDSPVSINTAYFPVSRVVDYGKFAARLWPGAKVRRAISRTQLSQFSEYSRGQLELS